MPVDAAKLDDVELEVAAKGLAFVYLVKHPGPVLAGKRRGDVAGEAEWPPVAPAGGRHQAAPATGTRR